MNFHAFFTIAFLYFLNFNVNTCFTLGDSFTLMSGLQRHTLRDIFYNYSQSQDATNLQNIIRKNNLSVSCLSAFTKPILSNLTFNNAIYQIIDGIILPFCVVNETLIVRDTKSYKMWLFGFLSVTVINCCAALGILFIPIMKHSFYKVVMSFLISLAVGSLSGSSLLILIPDAIQIEDLQEASGKPHINYRWKSTVVFLGIYMFFLLERFLKWIIQRKAKMSDATKKFRHGSVNISRQAKSKMNVRYEHDRSDSLMSPSTNGRRNQSSQKRAENPPKAVEHKKPISPTSQYSNRRVSESDEPRKNQFNQFRDRQNNDPTLAKKGNRPLSQSSNRLNNQSLVQDATNNRYSRSVRSSVSWDTIRSRRSSDNIARHYARPQDAGTNDSGDNVKSSRSEQFIDVKSSSSNQLSRHSHTSLRDEQPAMDQKKSKYIAPVAWMIIFGDALHNFVDGLSIGAAFSGSIVKGVSLSIAVLCEELPHELGDYAILINSGMSVKKAVLWNLLSSATCYLGFIFGVVLGEMTTGSVWIFAVAGGMFLYISLVDMMPEINAALESSDAYLKKFGAFRVFMIQNVGLLLGYSIILIMSLYGNRISIS